MYSFSISTCAAAATEKVRTPESNPLFVRLFSGFCYFSPDTARSQPDICTCVQCTGGIITKKLQECPCLCRQYFISDIKGAARELVDNDGGRAGQSILSSGPRGVVKT